MENENIIIKPCSSCSNFVNFDLSRIKTKLDFLFDRKDFDEAERLMKYWIDEAVINNNKRVELELKNEYMGLLRKLNREEDAIKIANDAYNLIYELNVQNSVSVGTIFINIGTVYKAFFRSREAKKYFDIAKEIYEKNLDRDDILFAGLYNNMGLMLVDIKEFDEALNLYNRAINILKINKKNELDCAITYLNIADLYYKKNNGNINEDIEVIINDCIESAWQYLNRENILNDEYYRFVIEKCMPSFSFYGYFVYEKKLKDILNK